MTSPGSSGGDQSSVRLSGGGKCSGWQGGVDGKVYGTLSGRHRSPCITGLVVIAPAQLFARGRITSRGLILANLENGQLFNNQTPFGLLLVIKGDGTSYLLGTSTHLKNVINY